MNASYDPTITLPPRNSTETEDVTRLLGELNWDDADLTRTETRAQNLIATIRTMDKAATEIESFLERYPLSSAEGLALMTLAEGLLRIPDAETADALIAEKFASARWGREGGGSDNLSKLIALGISLATGTTTGFLGNLLGGVSKPLVRKGVSEAIRQLGGQFVMGENITDALKKGKNFEDNGYRMSFDMLGEGARTWADADKYMAGYITAARYIGTINAARLPHKQIHEKHGISVKLSALHPKYTWLNAAQCVPEITERLLHLAGICAAEDITLTVDAEESERLELSLAIITTVLKDKSLIGYTGFGLAVQAYDRRAGDVIDTISENARECSQSLQIRLVKGAYWDTEIKRAQTAGWDSYPLYTRKSHTDLSYLRNAAKLLTLRDHIRPMFATHNPQTAASILDMAGKNTSNFEFQRLHGMGFALGEALRRFENTPVTIYAPVGEYQDLLAYLVRRMLENGANTSFASKLRNKDQSAQNLSQSPLRTITVNKGAPPKSLPLPQDLYGSTRKNAKGFDLSRAHNRSAFFAHIPHSLPPVHETVWGIEGAFKTAQTGFAHWSQTSAQDRAHILRKTADTVESQTGLFMALLQQEGQKTLADALSEIRETVDFLRYYAQQGEKTFSEKGALLPGPTGENNILTLVPRGIFVCISPWNFPLAIFVGQVAAALMAGNTVIAKPAEQTPKIAHFVRTLFLGAGLPEDALIVTSGDGAWGAQLVAHDNVAGVAFTGSHQAAQSINRALAAKNGAIVPFIAETGGQNAMIVDSTALLEQALDDVITSAFGSAGQRCSALRVLYVQDDIAPRFLDLLKGGMELLRIGDPKDTATDIPPVIDKDAYDRLMAHQKTLDHIGIKIAQTPIPEGLANAYYVAPCAYEITSITQIPEEVFGPILHIIRFKASDLETIVQDINNTGFGLTFGLHTRLAGRMATITQDIKAGNIYLNRSMIGAVVGVQPFGGQGLSGTGPKAGGPHYLARFACEKLVSNNIMALGGNVALMTQTDLE